MEVEVAGLPGVWLVQRPDGWTVDTESECIGPFSSQAEAEEYARERNRGGKEQDRG